MRAPRLHSAGFTLIELLVALAIVALIGTIGLTGLSRVIDQQEISNEHAQRWREVQFAMRIIQQDLTQLQPRPTRDELGEGSIPAILASDQAVYALEFSRGGWSNPAGFPRGNVGRVAYDWDEGRLIRYQWPVIDRVQGTEPVRSEILSDVIAIEVLFLNAAGEWVIDWPEAGAGGGSSQNFARPRAINFTIELEDYGTINRLVETIGG